MSSAYRNALRCVHARCATFILISSRPLTGSGSDDCVCIQDDGAGNAAADRLGSAVGAVRWESTLEGRICVRMVTAFDTTDEEIAAAVRALAGAGARVAAEEEEERPSAS